jgi:hypothetical protein
MPIQSSYGEHNARQYVVTYEIVTPESAACGDGAERGFVLPYDHVVLGDGVCGEEAGKLRDTCRVTLRQALRLVGLCEDSGSWFTEADSRLDVHTGGEERRSLHLPDNITGASYRRIGRLVGTRP